MAFIPMRRALSVSLRRLVPLSANWWRASNENGPRKGARKCQIKYAGSGQRDIRCGLAAIAAGFDVEGHFLVVGKAGQPCALDSRNMDENVLAAALRGDEAVALSCVEPFDGAIGHPISPLVFAARPSAAARLSQSKIE